MYLTKDSTGTTHQLTLNKQISSSDERVVYLVEDGCATIYRHDVLPPALTSKLQAMLQKDIHSEDSAYQPN